MWVGSQESSFSAWWVRGTQNLIHTLQSPLLILNQGLYNYPGSWIITRVDLKITIIIKSLYGSRETQNSMDTFASERVL